MKILKAVIVSLVLAVTPALGRAQDLRTGLEQLAGQIGNGMPATRQVRLAVIDFPDLQGTTSDFGRFVASRLTTRLAQNARVLVVERQRLGQVLAELRFSMSDLVDPAKAKRLGQMAGVDAIVVGTVAELGNQIDVDARVIDIETNSLMFGTSLTISRDPSVTEMLKMGRREQSVGQPAGGESPPAVPGAALRSSFRFDGNSMSLEITRVEVAGGDIRLTFRYVNKLEDPRRGAIYSPSDINTNYLVDNIGNRYGYTGDSFGQGRWFAPGIPEQIWISFGKLKPGASAVNMVLKWYVEGVGAGPIIMREIPLQR